MSSVCILFKRYFDFIIVNFAHNIRIIFVVTRPSSTYNGMEMSLCKYLLELLLNNQDPSGPSRVALKQEMEL